jgi:hypothetical protein
LVGITGIERSQHIEKRLLDFLLVVLAAYDDPAIAMVRTSTAPSNVIVQAKPTTTINIAKNRYNYHGK